MSTTGHNTTANLGTRSRGWRRRRVWRQLLLWLSISPTAIALLFQLQPAHVVLDIPVTPNAVGYFWWEEQTSQLSYADGWGVLYLHRKVGTAYPETQGWVTAEQAFAHFNSWLTANGWVYAGIGIDSATVPESRFLKPEQGRRFYRATDRNIQATVTVWPTSAPSNSLHVIVTTERPSWLRILQNNRD